MIEIEKIKKCGDLIKLWISLINEIRGLIEEISKFKVNLGLECNKLNSMNEIE